MLVLYLIEIGGCHHRFRLTGSFYTVPGQTTFNGKRHFVCFLQNDMIINMIISKLSLKSYKYICFWNGMKRDVTSHIYHIPDRFLFRFKNLFDIVWTVYLYAMYELNKCQNKKQKRSCYEEEFAITNRAIF